MNEGFAKTCVLAPRPGVGDADAGRRILGYCDGYLVRAAGFIGHVQRLDEPLGSTGSTAGTIQLCLRPLADWPKDCTRRFDGHNAN